MMTIQNFTVLEPRPVSQSLCLVEEITHRVLNEYAEAIATLRLALASATDGRSETTLKSAVVRLRPHSEERRALRSRAHSGPTNLADYIGQLCACLTRSSLADRRVWLTLLADEIGMDAAHCWRVGLIVSELIRDSTEHGFSGGPSAIRVEIAETSGHISCAVFDNGHRRASIGDGGGRRLVHAWPPSWADQSTGPARRPVAVAQSLNFPSRPRSNLKRRELTA
jgi:two-component sensor histidine kinase